MSRGQMFESPVQPRALGKAFRLEIEAPTPKASNPDEIEEIDRKTTRRDDEREDEDEEKGGIYRKRGRKVEVIDRKRRGMEENELKRM